jgi:hypothetical protein
MVDGSGVAAFEASLAGDHAPGGLPPPLLALWHAGRGEWEKAHGIVQALDGRDAAWVHAHLHRREGDQGNASYWYGRAGREPSSVDLTAEWREIAAALLAPG